MKIKIFLIIPILFVLFLITLPASSATPFEVTHILSVPYFNPGDENVEIQFIVQNVQDTRISNARVYLYMDYPFSASITPNNILGELSYPGYLIGTGQTGYEYTEKFNLGPGRSRKTLFKIDVDRNAGYGSHEIPYTVFYDYQGEKEYNGKITVNVSGYTLVDVTNVDVISNDMAIEPGETFGVNILLENVGENLIKWLRLSLIPEDSAVVPVTSDSEQIFTNIPHGDVRSGNFNFSVEKDADVKNYGLNMILNYKDETGAEFNDSRVVGVAVLGKGGLEIAKKTTDPSRITTGEPFILTLKVENSGTGDAKGVSATLESSFEGDTLAYLGEIEKDDYANAIFSLEAEDDGTFDGVLRINYEDDYGKHEVSHSIQFMVVSRERSGTILFFAILVILVGLGLWKMKK